MVLHAPLYSSISLIAELIISGIIISVIYQGYKNNVFFSKLTFFALAYEVLFNISYMVRRSDISEEVKPKLSFETALAITHGVLSLVMFISLIIFLLLAWKNYKKRINYFKENKKMTFTFVIFWLISVVSGMTFYFVNYLKFA